MKYRKKPIVIEAFRMELPTGWAHTPWGHPLCPLHRLVIDDVGPAPTQSPQDAP
jgi:hypothetical protein